MIETRQRTARAAERAPLLAAAADDDDGDDAGDARRAPSTPPSPLPLQPHAGARHVAAARVAGERAAKTVSYFCTGKLSLLPVALLMLTSGAGFLAFHSKTGTGWILPNVPYIVTGLIGTFFFFFFFFFF